MMSNDPEEKQEQQTEEAPSYDDCTAYGHGATYAPEPPALVWGAQPWDGAVWANETDEASADEQSESGKGEQS